MSETRYVELALQLLETPLLVASDETRRAVGALLQRWAEDPAGQHESMRLIVTLLSQHVPNEYVAGKFGSPTDKGENA
jgi:hypothetical protein